PRKVMPIRGRIDAHDKDQVAFEIESVLHNAGMPEAGSAPIIDRVARAQNPIELNAAIRDGLRSTDGLLARAGITDDALRSKLTRLHVDTHDATQTSVRAALTNQGPTPTPVMINGEAVDVLDPVLVNELAPKFLSLPDAREIRRVTSKYSNLFTRGGLFSTTSGEARMATSVLEGFQNEIWKPLQLMRAAWTVRVVGEEQVRMAAAGYDSMFRHPLSFISMRIGRKGATDISGDLLEDANQFKNAMSRSNGAWVDRAVVPTGVKTTYTKANLVDRDRYL